MPDLDDVSRVRFDGLSGEASWRFLERSATNPVAATVSVEPRWARVDGTSGQGLTTYALEVKLFVDAVLIPDRLYGGVNLNYAPGVQKADNDSAAGWVRASATNLSGALAYQVSERLFVGAELRHIAIFDGAVLERKVGETLFGGPTLLYRLNDTTALNVVWTPQLWGRGGTASDRLDLDNFERHQFRLKLATAF